MNSMKMAHYCLLRYPAFQEKSIIEELYEGIEILSRKYYNIHGKLDITEKYYKGKICKIIR